LTAISLEPTRPPATALFTGLAVFVSAAFLCSVPVSWFHPQWGSFRTAGIALCGVVLLTLAVQRRFAKGDLRASLPRWALGLFWGSALVYFVAATVSRFGAFAINGIDFSIFDWMLESTLRGRFMYTPIYRVNHFSVHPSYVMLLLVPLHALWRSPAMLLVFGAGLVWAAGIPLWQLAMAETGEEGIALLAVVALWGNPWTASLTAGGFRIESFYPLGVLLLLSGWVRSKPVTFWAGAVLLLSIKEDAALYLGAFAVGGLLFDRARWRELLGLLAASLAVLVVDVKFVQPLASAAGRAPGYVKFWAGYGASMPEVAWTALGHPGRVVWDVVRSAWWRFFGPALFLPLLEVRSLFAVAPGMLMLGMASYPMMRGYLGYYAVPMVGFAFWGILRFAGRPSPVARGAGVAALLLFPIIGGGQLLTPKPDWAALRGIAAARRRLNGSSNPVCVQTVLFPHLPYTLDLHALNARCLGEPGAVALVALDADPIPYTRSELVQRVATARANGRAEAFEGGIYLLGPAPR